ncbi:MAG: FAD-dependent thymidylate synthase [Synergistaceae bacterium]|nr:FAD-dependent thymidylate synthase [Synergistaceae bacterium]
MEVKLLTPPEYIGIMERNAAIGHLTCHANADKEFEPKEVLTRAIKAEHETTLEHITLTYSVKGLSRACLQELARHRHISLSVESTRHTLTKNATREFIEKHFPYSSGKFGSIDSLKYAEAEHFITLAENYPALSDDELKYFLPEFWPTNLILTSNIRELRHILKLRTSPAALKEFRSLAYSLYEAIPEEYRYLLEDCVYRENGHD